MSFHSDEIDYRSKKNEVDSQVVIQIISINVIKKNTKVNRESMKNTIFEEDICKKSVLPKKYISSP